jgi:2-keto-4-pentenoate hydratase/2-oxohepta-3-ene-1,7-dioic acid hydratase in catechol pathway
MRLLRFRHENQARLGRIVPGGVEICDGSPLTPKPTGEIADAPADADLLPPIVPTDILCIGLNYRAHAAETGSTPPRNPMLFIKSSNALAGPADAVRLPSNSDRVDFEAELVAVIGRDAKDVDEADALDYVFGYTLANDVSARDWQKDKALNGGQFARGKSFDGFCPLGPHLVTADEVPDPQNLAVRLTLNGETMQDSTTADMIFGVAQIVASLSRTMTLRAGSIVLTGTPAGVGVARTPPVFLKPGDETRITIGDLGTLVTRFDSAE